LKVKKRSLLIIVAMLSICLFGIGTAYAITGVADDVPGEDVVFPIICEGTVDANGDAVFGSLDTIWAIADKGSDADLGCTVSDSVCDPKLDDPADKSGIGVVYTDVFVQDMQSRNTLDSSACWSHNDVVSGDCQDLINQMSQDKRVQMLTTIANKSYFAGYVVYQQTAVCGEQGFGNRFIPWVYLQDVVKGFSAGFNGVSIEDGVGPELGEDGDIGITANQVFPRYFILNGDPDTFNWWIFLAGRNQYAFGPQANLTRTLQCFLCNEHEYCYSTGLDIPYELNIINVGQVLPGALKASYPEAGFAYCTIKETGNLPGEPGVTQILGTLSFTDDEQGSVNGDAETYSLLGWAYERAKPISNNVKLSVIHPIHRTYCARGSGGREMPDGSFFGDNSTESYQYGTDDLPGRFGCDEPNNDFCSITGPVPTIPYPY
jgi:hypothetical protein